MSDLLLRRRMMMQIGGSPTPPPFPDHDYIQLAYLQWGNSAVAFQTGVFYDSTQFVGWDITFEFTSISGRQDLLVCMGGSNYAGVQRGNNNIFKIQYSGNSYAPTVNVGTKYNYNVNPTSGLLTIDGVSTTTITPVKNYQSYFVLGGWRQGNNLTIPSSNMTLRNCKVYELKLIGSSNNSNIIWWLPAMRRADSVLGWWDMVNNTFVVQQGSGTLSYGTL